MCAGTSVGACAWSPFTRATPSTTADAPRRRRASATSCHAARITNAAKNASTSSETQKRTFDGASRCAARSARAGGPARAGRPARSRAGRATARLRVGPGWTRAGSAMREIVGNIWLLRWSSRPSGCPSSRSPTRPRGRRDGGPARCADAIARVAAEALEADLAVFGCSTPTASSSRVRSRPRLGARRRGRRHPVSLRADRRGRGLRVGSPRRRARPRRRSADGGRRARAVGSSGRSSSCGSRAVRRGRPRGRASSSPRRSRSRCAPWRRTAAPATRAGARGSSWPARRSPPAGDARRAAQQAVRIAVETTGARGGVLWRVAGAASQSSSHRSERSTL